MAEIRTSPKPAKLASHSLHHESVPERNIVIVWLRNDLRTHDQAHFHALHTESADNNVTHVLPLYILDERLVELSGLPGYQRQGPEARTEICGFWKTGVFRTRFQAEAVYDLKDRLRTLGSDLIIRFGKPEQIIPSLIKAYHRQGDHIKAVYFQNEIAPDEIATEKIVVEAVEFLQIQARGFQQKQLIHVDDLPFTVKETPDVFTPFRKRVEALRQQMAREPLPLVTKFKPIPLPLPTTDDYGAGLEDSVLEDVLPALLKPLSKEIQLELRFDQHGHKSAFPYSGGETAALARLDWYFESGSTPPPVARYKQTRNHLLGHGYSTKMSPFLCHGAISPRTIIQKLLTHEKAYGSSQNTYWVQFELLWRDYFMYITLKYGDQLFKLGGFEEITDPKQAIKKLDGWNKWDATDPKLRAWMTGQTGVPFVDANMIELLQSGFMSNRGRQNVASFLTKDLYYDWRIGAEYFQSNLVDYDPSANYGNWQYVSGVGNDPRASRQFNPIKQGKDYDIYGAYIKHWIPKLTKVPTNYIHAPWLLTKSELADLGVHHGDYPYQPLIEQDSWKPHYYRRDGDRSKMSGNTAERVRAGAKNINLVPQGSQHEFHERSHGRLAGFGSSAAPFVRSSTPPIASPMGSWAMPPRSKANSPVKHMRSLQTPADTKANWRAPSPNSASPDTQSSDSSGQN